MVDLAEHKIEGFRPLTEIARRQEISKKYLEIIIKKLLEAKMVLSLSGKGGGSWLARDPGDYSAGEILECLQETLTPVACLKKDAFPCIRKNGCKALPLWQEYDELVHHFLYA